MKHLLLRRAPQQNRLLVSIMSIAVLLAGLTIPASSADAAPPATAVASRGGSEVTVEELTAAVSQQLADDLLAARVAQRRANAGLPADDKQIAIPAAIVAAIVVCASGAVASVGLGLLQRLIGEGNIGRARQLLGDAIAGCVGSVAGGLVVRACRAIPPCRRAMDRLITEAVERIIRELRGE